MVITVPAYFGVLEREATRKAGQIAGLNVLDVIAEPVAAALNYETLDHGGGLRHIFIYDLGGGTFDTTVIRIEGDNVQVVCTDGNHHLGGADWDRGHQFPAATASPRSTPSSIRRPTSSSCRTWPPPRSS